MRTDPSTVGAQTRATRAILKSCIDHGHPGQVHLDHIRECLRALELGDVLGAVKNYRSIHFGPYGFGDWFPPVVCDHEDEGYVLEVFEALCERWHRLMELLSEGRRVS